MKMAEAFAVMRQELNRRAVEATRREYEQFVQELDRDHQSMSSCLRVKPVEMQRRLEGKRQELLERCRGELRGEDPQKQAALEELKKELDKQMAEFLPRYEQRFKVKKAEWLGLYIGRGGTGFWQWWVRVSE
nr:RING finger protein 112-like [Chrysemys picta bellii]